MNEMETNLIDFFKRLLVVKLHVKHSCFKARVNITMSIPKDA